MCRSPPCRRSTLDPSGGVVLRHRERFAQQALGHNSKAVHRAYARHAHVIIPPLGEYEKQAEAQRVIPFPARVSSANDAPPLPATPEGQGDGIYQGHA